jgi:hypothetical protein
MFAVEPSKLKKSIWFDYYTNNAILFYRLSIFWIGTACFSWKCACGTGFIKAVEAGYWFLRLFKFKPFSMSILLNWLQVIFPLWLLSAYRNNLAKHSYSFSYRYCSSLCHERRCFNPWTINSYNPSCPPAASKASLKNPRIYLSILIARLVVSLYVSAFNRLRAVLGEYIGVKTASLGSSI